MAASDKITLSRRKFMKSLAATTAVASLAGADLAFGAKADRRPDVLFISIEDVSPHRFGCWGNTVCKTPNIDQLAGQSLRFDLAHCSAPPCNPSRTSLLSGLRPETTKVFGNATDWSEVLKPGTTMPEHFRANGYETIRVGKIFHRGNKDRVYNDTARWSRVIKENEGLPRPKSRRLPLKGPGVEFAKKKQEAARQGIYIGGGSPFSYGPSGLDDLEETDGMSATQAIKLLSQKRDKPLFLALGFHKPHLAFTAPQKYFDMYLPAQMIIPKNPDSDADGMPTDKSKLSDKNPYTLKQWREAIAAHYACVTFIDAQVGRVLEALAKSGRADNTIIVLWSDHGFMLGEHYLWRKGPLYDECVMVALLIKAPGVTKPAGVCKRPVESIDIFPTLFDLCGIPIPDGLEGISMKPLLKNPSMPWKKGAITVRGERDKSIRTERWRYTEYGGPDKAELFDHQTDPHEFINLAKDPKYADVVAELSRLLKAGWKATLPNPSATGKNPAPDPVYPLYAICSGVHEPTRQDLEVLARNFALAQASFSPSDIRTLHELNPDFKAVKYFNSSYTSSADEVPRVEQRFRRALTMFRAAVLGQSIDTKITEFALQAPRKNRPIALKASTLPGSLSSAERNRPSTKYYVTWIRIGDELMRIDTFDVTSGRIKVTRGFDKSQPAAHKAGSPVFSPVYLGSTNDTGAYPGGPGSNLRYAFDPANAEAARWCIEKATICIEQGYDGVWLDICSPNPFNMADSDGNHVAPWDFRTGQDYDRDAYREGQEIKIHAVQTAIYKKFGSWPVVIANNMGSSRTFEPGQGGSKLMLMPTEIKPRPLDGYSIENFAGSFAARAVDRIGHKGPRYHSLDTWRSKLMLLAKSAQQKLAAYPMIANAGSKSKMLEPFGDIRDRFETFAYASYLLAVEKDAPTRLGLPAFYEKDGRRYAYLHPRYSWPIGAPTQTYQPDQIDRYRPKGYLSYVRRFDNGLVIVNPSEKDDRKLNLDKTYLDLEIQKEISSIQMKAHTGKILLRK